MRIFILEDDFNRIEVFQKYLSDHELTIVSESNEAIKILEKDCSFDLFYLDHDLGGLIYVDIGVENTGSTVAKYMSDKNIKGTIIIHSFNSVGAKNMLDYLPNAFYVPFNPEFIKRTNEWILFKKEKK